MLDDSIKQLLANTPGLVVWLTGAGMVVTGNHFRNVEIVVNDGTGTDRPIIIRVNLLENSEIKREAGSLIGGID